MIKIVALGTKNTPTTLAYKISERWALYTLGICQGQKQQEEATMNYKKVVFLLSVKMAQLTAAAPYHSPANYEVSNSIAAALNFLTISAKYPSFFARPKQYLHFYRRMKKMLMRTCPP